MKKLLGIFGLLLVVCVATHLMSPQFLTAYNIENLFRRTALFGVLSIVIVAVLLRTTAELTQWSKLASIGVPVVIGGAIGNLLDRVRQRDGVVDFIDIGVGDVRFWTFNVADSAVTVGAICLVLALWQQEREQMARDKARGDVGQGGAAGGTATDPSRS